MVSTNVVHSLNHRSPNQPPKPEFTLPQSLFPFRSQPPSPVNSRTSIVSPLFTAPDTFVCPTPFIKTNLQLSLTYHDVKCLHRLGILQEALPRAVNTSLSIKRMILAALRGTEPTSITRAGNHANDAFFLPREARTTLRWQLLWIRTMGQNVPKEISDVRHRSIKWEKSYWSEWMGMPMASLEPARPTRKRHGRKSRHALGALLRRNWASTSPLGLRSCPCRN